MCAGKIMAYCNDFFLVDTKGYFSLLQEAFEISTETRIWPAFFLINMGGFFLKTFGCKIRKRVKEICKKKLLGIPTVWSGFKISVYYNPENDHQHHCVPEKLEDRLF